MSKPKNTLTLTLPTWFLRASQVVDYNLKATTHRVRKIDDLGSKNPFKNLNFDKYLPGQHKLRAIQALILVAIVILGVFAFRLATNGSGEVDSAKALNPQTQAPINKRFEVPIRDSSGKETGDKLAITLTSIDRADQILIQGKRATARDTKQFLVINLEVENSTRNQLTVRPVDLIRLVEADGRNYAPDVHNNKVTVEPVSIKKTRAGFVIDKDRENFKFLIGEVRGNQEVLELTI